jgi:hypothetical protein
LLQRWGWRAIFYLNFPFCLLGYLLAIFVVRLNAVVKLSIVEKFRRTDWIGAFLFIGSTTSILVGLSFGGVQHPWTSAAALVPIFLGLAGLVVFVLWQIRVSPRSLLPLSLFYCASAFAAFYCAAMNGLLVSSCTIDERLWLTFLELFTGLYYIPFFSMAVKAASPTRSGVDLIPALVFILPGSIVVSVITARLGRFRWAIWVGWSITLIGTGLLLLLDLNVTMAVNATALAVFGLGSGMVLSSVNYGIQSISKVEDSAMAASMYGFMRSLGMPLGVAVSIFRCSRTSTFLMLRSFLEPSSKML